jgi:hypothetical protein
MRSTRLAKPLVLGPKKEVIHLLESFAVAAVAGHVAHQQHHGRGVLESRVHPDGGVGGARPARNHAYARPAGQLAVGLGHKGRAALLPAGDKLDLALARMQAVEHCEVAFAGHAERVGNALGQKAIDEEVAGKLWGGHEGYCAAGNRCRHSD